MPGVWRCVIHDGITVTSRSDGWPIYGSAARAQKVARKRLRKYNAGRYDGPAPIRVEG